MKISRELLWVAAAIVPLLAAGCSKKVAKATPPPPAPAASTPTARSTPSTPARQTARNTPPPASPISRTPDAKTRARIDELLARIQDAYFDYDKHELRPDALKTLESDSKELRDIIVQYPNYKLTIEGYCDERGSAEYNMALGDARAKAAKDYLVGVGIPGDQLKVVSYGKEKQVCDEHNETCWQKNRRIHILAMAE
ncbi:MAG TPA: OmpA family protein [Bryobacteraceae bacterium]|nr:OmpA family protein [Bryobacteraceae bacterium]